LVRANTDRAGQRRPEKKKRQAKMTGELVGKIVGGSTELLRARGAKPKL
jgi:hypothetical protein